MSFGVFDFENSLVEATTHQTEATALASTSTPAEEQQYLPNAKRFKPTQQVVCRHWLRNMCVKGDYCDFLHTFDPSRMPICKRFRKQGYCADHERGVCLLRHEHISNENASDVGDDATVDENNESAMFAGSLRDAMDRPKTTLCMQYLFGFCPNGPRCVQLHLRRRPEDMTDLFYPDWYLSSIVSNRSVIPPMDEETRKSVRKWDAVYADAYKIAAASLPSIASVKSPIEEGRSLASILPPNSLTKAACNIHNNTDNSNIRAFIIKSVKIENILTSVQRGVWATSKMNAIRFEEAFNSARHVLFIYSANESGGFQGYARMASLCDPNLYPGLWGSFSSKLSPNYRIQWLKQCKVDFEQLASFTNPANENKPIKKSRDGQVSGSYISFLKSNFRNCLWNWQKRFVCAFMTRQMKICWLIRRLNQNQELIIRLFLS